MRKYVTGFFLIINIFCAGPSFSRVVVYNYTPAIPAFTLVSITPQDHQSFNESPQTVYTSFSMPVDPAKSTIQVFDPYNNPLVTTPIMPKDTSLQLQLPPHLLAGTYRIEWSAACTCVGNPPINGIATAITPQVNTTILGTNPVETSASPQGNPTINGTTYFTVY